MRGAVAASIRGDSPPSPSPYPRADAEAAQCPPPTTARSARASRDAHALSLVRGGAGDAVAGHGRGVGRRVGGDRPRGGGRRPRLRRLPPLAGAPSELSFPSAHATASLAAATAMARVAPGASLPLYGLAGAICVTRPYLGMHYPSDVLAGAALGLAIGAAWPGLAGRGAEDRLIDLVANAPRPGP